MNKRMDRMGEESMEMVGLISGGKDSMYNMMCAVKEGWKVFLSSFLVPPNHCR